MNSKEKINLFTKNFLQFFVYIFVFTQNFKQKESKSIYLFFETWTQELKCTSERMHGRFKTKTGLRSPHRANEIRNLRIVRL